LSIPEGNDVLIVVLSTGQSWPGMAYYVAMTVAGSVTGCLMLFALGRRGGRFLQRHLDQRRIEKLEATYRRWGVWSILIPSILPPPTPFKVFVLWAGMVRVPTSKFLLAVVLGRSVRYLMWGILAVVYGTMARDFLESNLRPVGLALFAVLVAAAVYGIFWHRSCKAKAGEEVA
jgi:membrane protein DedA with SNARE-associated domain